MTILESLTNLLLAFIEHFGLVGIAVVTAIESIIVPIPSEIVLPFAGYLAWRMKSSAFIVYCLAAAVLGNIIGALTLYFVGLKLGKPFFERYGKYLFIKREDLEIAEGWFLRYGAYAIFFGRMVPSIRSLISFPAGMFSFDIKKFILLTSVGCIPWNFALIYVGYTAGPYWDLFIDEMSSPYLDAVIIAAAVIAVMVYLKRRGKSRK